MFIAILDTYIFSANLIEHLNAWIFNIRQHNDFAYLLPSGISINIIK
jgi:hypothetical protein